MTIQSIVDLPEDYAIILLQVRQSGKEEFLSLAERLDIDVPRMQHIVKALQHKGLLVVRSVAQNELWIRLSKKAQKLMSYAEQGVVSLA
jgi:DNA-binding MarR family transcriptional regulator